LGSDFGGGGDGYGGYDDDNYDGSDL
jgi:hypothetical protein